MRITTLLLLMGLMQTYATNSYSQNTKLSLKMENASIEIILSKIEKISEFHFFFRSNEINSNDRHTIDANEQTIDEVLNSLLKGSKLTYKIFDKYIAIVSKENANGNIESLFQQKSISGKVTDQSGVPLPGVSVVVKGTTTGVITDNYGNYSLANIPENAILAFSFVGMKGQEIPVSGKSTINVTLAEEAIGIDEVVAVGYGTQKRGTMTSAVSVVKADEINKGAVADVTNSLAGKTAGLIVRNYNALPGADASTISVRGVSTTGDNSALIVVDGIPDRSMTQIDVNDIESVSVLKDASAVAPYGSRGANGVILITTKRGKTGKPTINYNAYYGTNQPTILPKFASSADYARMQNEAKRNEGMAESFSADDIAKYEAGTDPNYPNTDWWHAMMVKNPVQYNHNLSVSGANDNIKYYLSLGALRQDGYFGNTNYKRYNTRANIDANITKDLMVSFDLAGNIGNRSRPITNMDASSIDNIMGSALRIPGIWPIKNSTGQFVRPSVDDNPVSQIELGGGRNDKSRNFNGTIKIEYKPSYIKGLTLKGSGVYDTKIDDATTWFTPFETARLVNRPNGIYETVAPEGSPKFERYVLFSTTNQLEFQVDYKRTIAEVHNIGALVVLNRSQWNSNDLIGRRINYPSTAIAQLFAGGEENQFTTGSAYQGARMGYVGRLTYDYIGKYMFESNFRYDGSMNFAPGKRWGFFPSFAAGWRISEENFIRNNFKFIDNLKLRASWGKAGNDRIAAYQYLASYGYSTPYSFNGNLVQTAGESRLQNPDITWETGTLTDIGLEGSLWKKLLSFELDYFSKQTTDILRPTQRTSSIIGINLPDANIGIVDNKGFEFTIGHRHQLGDFKYNANFVFTYATNKAVEIGEAVGTLNDHFRRQTGNSLNAYYGYIAEGLFTSAEEIANSPSQGGGIMPGDIKYKDFSGPEGKPDGKVDSYDQTKIGYSNMPEIIYGFNLGAEYKGFDITLNFQGATHMDYLFTSFAANAFDNGGNIQIWQMENRWTTENNNPNAKYPRLTSGPTGNNTKQSSFWLRDGTYLRLKTAQFGYNLNKAMLSKINVQGLRVYVSGENVFTWVKDKLNTFDPEAYNERGRFYPQAKVFTMGLNLTF